MTGEVVASVPVSAPARAAARRLTLLGAAAALACADLVVKTWAATALDDDPIDAWPVGLRIAYNPAAFSLAADAPAWVMLTVTGVLTLAVAVIGWRTAPTAGLWWRTALAAILGGAAANVIGR